jgi:hypothetical protein
MLDIGTYQGTVWHTVGRDSGMTPTMLSLNVREGWLQRAGMGQVQPMVDYPPHGSVALEETVFPTDRNHGDQYAPGKHLLAK